MQPLAVQSASELRLDAKLEAFPCERHMGRLSPWAVACAISKLADLGSLSRDSAASLEGANSSFQDQLGDLVDRISNLPHKSHEHGAMGTELLGSRPCPAGHLHLYRLCLPLATRKEDELVTLVTRMSFGGDFLQCFVCFVFVPSADNQIERIVAKYNMRTASFQQEPGITFRCFTHRCLPS